MSARDQETAQERGEGARDKATSTRVIPLNQAISARRSVYPLLMIGGVYRMSFAMGLAVYALPARGACPSASISRHRARTRVRSTVHALRKTFTPSRADISPHNHQP